MYSQTYNLEEYQQVIKRLHRQGQLDTVNVYHLLAEKTIDGAIRKVLAEKDITQEALFTSLRNNLLQIS